MEIFKELNKKGYKHYYDGTIEELDRMDKNNPDLHSEIMQIIMWLYEKHGIWIQVKPGGKLETWDFITQKKDNTFAVPYFEIKQHKPFFNSPTEAYEAAIKYTLNNLI